MAGRLSTLHVTLLVSIGAHAALLGLHVGDPGRFDRLFRESPLEVILVNARSPEAPAKAQAIAQANLAGGGDAAAGRATSPLPPSPTSAVGDAADDTPQRRLEQLQETEQQLLHATAPRGRDAAVTEPQRDAAGTDRARAGGAPAPGASRRSAEIEKQVNEQNARPRKRYVSPATTEAVYALYYDALRRRIEDRGTRNFPESRGRKLYGELTMNVTVDAEGRAARDRDRAPVRSKELDRRAVAIVAAAAPFGRFTAGDAPAAPTSSSSRRASASRAKVASRPT